MSRLIKRGTLAILLTLNILISACSMIGWGSVGLSVKLYETNAERGGLYRAQENELVKWSEAHKKYACMSWDDYKAVKLYCSRRGS